MWDSPPYVALRHCIGAGMLARRLGNCECAASVGYWRDKWRRDQGWSADELDPDQHNDLEGRRSAGCTGSNADSAPLIVTIPLVLGVGPSCDAGKWAEATVSLATPPPSIDDICASCRAKLLSGELQMPNV